LSAAAVVLAVALSAGAEWVPYDSRKVESPEPRLEEPWQFSLKGGEGFKEEWLTITGDAKGARVEKWHRDSSQTTLFARGKLNAAQVKELRAKAAALKYWALSSATKKPALTTDGLPGPAPFGYRAQVQAAVTPAGRGPATASFDVRPGCPCEGCECPQAAFVALLQKFAESAGMKKVVATEEKKFSPGKPRGTPLDASCSEKPIAGAVHWCELARGGTTEKFDHCYPRGGGQFACFATPYSPGVLVKRVGEATGAATEDPWAIELESGDVCTRATQSSSWACKQGTQVGPFAVSKGNPWVVKLPMDDLVVVKALYR
jgi:hypothetical protein